MKEELLNAVFLEVNIGGDGCNVRRDECFVGFFVLRLIIDGSV